MQTVKNTISFFLKLFYPLFEKWMPFQVYAYLSVGAVNTLFNIALFTTCFFLLSNPNALLSSLSFFHAFAIEIATIISFITSVFTGFWLSKNFAFTNASNEKREKNKQFGKYFFVAIQGQLSGYLITKGLIIFSHINPASAYFVSTVVMLCVNYALQKYFTFNNRVVQ